MKKILITGGTGFLGKNLSYFLSRKYKNYKIFFSSRSIERCRVAKLDLDLDYFPCDISNLNSVVDCITKIKPNIIIHCAATKYVDLAEKFPFECVDTNILGTLNLLRVSKNLGVKDFIAISTDKAAPPYSNIYSLSKSIMEKALILDSVNSKINISCIRFGNLPWSTGSIFPIWEEMSKNKKIIKSTGPDMSRYFYSINNACNLIDFVLKNSQSLTGKIIVPEMKSAFIRDILDIWSKIYKVKWKKIKKREGDKNFESIISSQEFCKFELKKTNFGNIFLITNSSKQNKIDLNSQKAKKFNKAEIRDLILNKPKFL